MSEKLPQLQDAIFVALRQLYPTLTDTQRVNMYLLHRPIIQHGMDAVTAADMREEWLKKEYDARVKRMELATIFAQGYAGQYPVKN
jgi:hypothetical protein